MQNQTVYYEPLPLRQILIKYLAQVDSTEWNSLPDFLRRDITLCKAQLDKARMLEDFKKNVSVCENSSTVRIIMIKYTLVNDYGVIYNEYKYFTYWYWGRTVKWSSNPREFGW